MVNNKFSSIKSLWLVFVFLFLLLSYAYGEEDVLRILTGEGHVPNQFVDQFEKQIKVKYNRKIKLKIIILTGPEDWYKAIRGGKVDLVLLTHHHFKDERFNYIQNNLLIPLDLKNIPNFKHIIPTLQKAKYLNSDGKIYASPVSQGPYGLAYNAMQMKEAPQSWNILWSPRFRNKYAIGANEYVYNAVITALALGYPRNAINSFDSLNTHEFRVKLRHLVVNAHSFWIGVDKADDLIGLSMATSWGDSLGPLNIKGEPWKMAEPAEGMPSWIDNYTITWTLAKKPFLKKAAEEYINMLLSTDYQVGHILRTMSLSPVITNFNDLLTPKEKKQLKIGIPEFFSKNRILLPTYSQRDRNGLKLLWDEAMKDITVRGNGQ